MQTLKERLAIAGRILDPAKRERALNKIREAEEKAANSRRLDRKEAKSPGGQAGGRS